MAENRINVKWTKQDVLDADAILSGNAQMPGQPVLKGRRLNPKLLYALSQIRRTVGKEAESIRDAGQIPDEPRFNEYQQRQRQSLLTHSKDEKVVDIAGHELALIELRKEFVAEQDEIDKINKTMKSLLKDPIELELYHIDWAWVMPEKLALEDLGPLVDLVKPGSFEEACKVEAEREKKEAEEKKAQQEKEAKEKK